MMICFSLEPANIVRVWCLVFPITWQTNFYHDTLCRREENVLASFITVFLRQTLSSASELKRSSSARKIVGTQTTNYSRLLETLNLKITYKSTRTLAPKSVLLCFDESESVIHSATKLSAISSKNQDSSRNPAKMW
ncbi:hypothetical protein ACFE04_006612 [Oxalis oulophora]